MSEKEKMQVTFEYKMPQDNKIYAVHGVYGGINAFGEIIMNCYAERGPVP